MKKVQLRVSQWEELRRGMAGLTLGIIPALPRRPFNWHSLNL